MNTVTSITGKKAPQIKNRVRGSIQTKKFGDLLDALESGDTEEVKTQVKNLFKDPAERQSLAKQFLCDEELSRLLLNHFNDNEKLELMQLLETHMNAGVEAYRSGYPTIDDDRRAEQRAYMVKSSVFRVMERIEKSIQSADVKTKAAGKIAIYSGQVEAATPASMPVF